MTDPIATLAERLAKIDATLLAEGTATVYHAMAREAFAFVLEQASEPDFVHALQTATARFKDHPHWRRLEGTPWENDAPVIAADLMCAILRDLRARLGGY